MWSLCVKCSAFSSNITYLPLSQHLIYSSSEVSKHVCEWRDWMAGWLTGSKPKLTIFVKAWRKVGQTEEGGGVVFNSWPSLFTAEIFNLGNMCLDWDWHTNYSKVMLFSSSRGVHPTDSGTEREKERTAWVMAISPLLFPRHCQIWCFSLCRDTSLLWAFSLSSCSKKINTVWYKATGLKLIENPHTVLWQQIVYLFVGRMCVPVLQCWTKRICVYVCVPLHCVRGNSLLGLWRVQCGVMNRMLLCSVSQLSANQWRRERWERKGQEVREIAR